MSLLLRRAPSRLSSRSALASLMRDGCKHGHPAAAVVRHDSGVAQPPVSQRLVNGPPSLRRVLKNDTMGILPHRGQLGLSSAAGGCSFSGVRSASYASVTRNAAEVGNLTSHSIDVAKDGRLRLATILDSTNQTTVAVVKNGKIWRLADALPQSDKAAQACNVDDMTSVIEHWPAIASGLLLRDDASQALEGVRVAAPFPRPRGTIMCIGKNYADHVKEVDTWKTAPGITQPSIPEHPIVFTKAPQSVVSTGSAIRLPPSDLTTAVDYEAELALVIGKQAKAVSKDEAMDYIFGYTILNDVTARDVQKRHQQWFLGKSCDTFCPMGPWIVPASELNGEDLAIQCWINDDLRQNGRTSQLIFPIPELIATISKCLTLMPGDIIATGTPSGVGSGFKPPKHLKGGDALRIRIESVGELTNTVTI